MVPHQGALGLQRRHPHPTCASGLPASVGLGLRHQFADELANGAARADFVEIHAENYLSEGGPSLTLLDRIVEHFPLSIHGVGLSIGSPEPLDGDHLAQIRRLCDRADPLVFSEHLAWSRHDGVYFNDLLPTALNSAMLVRVVEHIDAVQTALARPILIENPSTYLRASGSDWDEVDFLREMARRSGCRLLLDVNNVHVSCHNLGEDSHDYIARFPLELVCEIHLAGFERAAPGPHDLLIDTHGAAVSEPVWWLYEDVIERAGTLPTLIERDNNIPPLAELLREVDRAASIMADVQQW